MGQTKLSQQVSKIYIVLKWFVKNHHRHRHLRKTK